MDRYSGMYTVQQSYYSIVTHVSIRSEQYRVRLDVPVNDALRVQVRQGLQTLFADRGDLLL